MKLAIFDLDGTVLRANSWRLYFRRMYRTWPSCAPAFSWGLVRRAGGVLDGRGLREVSLRPLRGMTVAEVRDTGVSLAKSELFPLVRPGAHRELARCAADGCELVLATGAFDFIAEAMACELGIRRVVCTRLDYDQAGRCTGRIMGAEARGRAKADAVSSLMAGERVDWSSSCAFSDDMEDAPLFSLVGRAVLVGRPPAQTAIPVETADWD